MYLLFSKSTRYISHIYLLVERDSYESRGLPSARRFLSLPARLAADIDFIRAAMARVPPSVALARSVADARPFDRSNRSAPHDCAPPSPRSARFEFFARENVADRRQRALSALDARFSSSSFFYREVKKVSRFARFLDKDLRDSLVNLEVK